VKTITKRGRGLVGKKLILYAHVSPINKAWVQKEAKFAGLTQGVYMDFLLKAARAKKFKITSVTGSR